MGRDVTDPERPAGSAARAEDRLRELQRVSLDLTAAVSIDQVVAAVTDALDAPISAPSRSLWLREPSGDVLRLIGHRGMPEDTAERFARIPLAADLPGAVAVRERRTVVSAARADAVEQFERLRGVPRSTSGFVAVPLIADRSCVGVMGIGVEDAFDERDVAFFEAVAAQVAQTIVRVRLTEREIRRRRELELLAGVTEAALAADDHVELMQQVCAAAVPTLGDWCSLYYLSEAGGPPLVVSVHVDPARGADLEELRKAHPYDPRGRTGVAAVIRTGRTDFLPELTPPSSTRWRRPRTFPRPRWRGCSTRSSITSAITVPLRTKRRVVGAMQFVSAESGGATTRTTSPWPKPSVAAWRKHSTRPGRPTSSEPSRSSCSRRSSRRRCPRSRHRDRGPLLAGGREPRRGRLLRRVRARRATLGAASSATRAAPVPNAAALTSIARHTVRAAARHGADAHSVVDWLNEAILHSNRDLFCTACYATLTARDGGWVLESTAAGHPLPIVATRAGAHAVGRPGTLLGVFDSVSTTTTGVELCSGDVVLLYTDGLTDLAPPYGILPSELADLVQRLRDDTSTADAIAAAHPPVAPRSRAGSVPPGRRRARWCCGFRDLGECRGEGRSARDRQPWRASRSARSRLNPSAARPLSRPLVVTCRSGSLSRRRRGWSRRDQRSWSSPHRRGRKPPAAR